MPADELVAPFLAHHIPGLTRGRAGRWSARWGSDLPERLTHGDIHLLATTLGGSAAHELALGAVTYWEAHQWEVEIAQLLYAWGGDDALVAATRDHYGPTASDALQTDPYRLLAFAPFAVVDPIARRAGVAADDDRRGIGAAVSVVQAWWEHGAWVLSEEVLLSDLAGCMGDDVQQVRRAIDMARQAGVLHSVGGATWMGDAAWRCCAYILDRLDALVGSGATPSEQPVRQLKERAHTITAAVTSITTMPLACISAPTRTTQAMFAAAWCEGVVSRGQSLVVVTESVQQAEYFEHVLGMPVSTLGDDPLGLRVASDAVLWLASSRRVGCWAKLLVSQPALQQLVVVNTGRFDDPVDMTRALLARYEEVPTLALAVDDRMDDSPFVSSPDEQCLAQINQAAPYDARDSAWMGVRWLHATSANLRQATIGVCYQQLRQGSVALLIDDPQERRTMAEQWTAALQEMSVAPPGPTLRVVGMADLAPGDVATVVIPVPSPVPAMPWWVVAMTKARDRVVWVGPAFEGDGAVGGAAPALSLEGARDVLRRVRPEGGIGRGD
ncbi:hypothetical protein Y882_07505 [Dyella japonica DSM 16301]|uniref:ATP-dependent RecD2 DNA helicase-like helix-hairpin-helix domain-containing protein n=2 Tax=Dyella japonica TaxID=231455 RepID=A0A0G9H4A3_9GAMM|nr:hypothetical protein Y882_07505 [Dyella japonica DSM 16301]